MKVVYFDARARPQSTRLNWSDLALYAAGFAAVGRDDVLLALAPSGADRYVVERRLVVTHDEVGGDSYDVYVEPTECVGVLTIERGDPRLGDWWPEPSAYLLQIPDAVVDGMGWARDGNRGDVDRH
jgi:hypothetical protein